MERSNAPQATSTEASACGLSVVQTAQGRTTAEVGSAEGPQGGASTRGAGMISAVSSVASRHRWPCNTLMRRMGGHKSGITSSDDGCKSFGNQ